MSLRPIFAFFSLLLLGLVTGRAPATGFNNEAAWQAAVGAFSLDTFESYATGTQIQNDLLLGISFDLLDDAATYPSVQSAASTGGTGAHSGSLVLLNDQDFSLPPRGPFVLRPTHPNDRLSGVGVWNVGGDDTIRLTMFDQNDMVIESFDSPASSGFVGIALGVPAARAEISGVAGNGYIPVDDLQVSLLRIPEPGAVLLATFALLGALAHRGLRCR